MQFYTYILYSPSLKKFFKGNTNNIKTCLDTHNKGLEEKSESGIPWQMLWYTAKPNSNEAFKLQKKLFNLTPQRLIAFMERYHTDIVDEEAFKLIDSLSK